MKDDFRLHPPLYWQSQLILLIVVPVSCIWILFQTVDAWERRDLVLLETAGICIAFGLTVWMTKAGTNFAVLTGTIITACLYLRTPGWRTALWPLVAMLILTLGATQFGRTRKEKFGVAESHSGRHASQVAANLGVAALASIPLFISSAGAPVAILAVLAEATADTLSSELGQVFGGQPRLMTTLRAVPVGADGGVTLAGTAAGCLGSALIAAVSAITFQLDFRLTAIVFACGVAGLFVDSLLGATLERQCLINNDAVNFLSTIVAAVCAKWIVK